MFDVSELLKELQEAIQIKDDPNTLNLKVLVKAPPGVDISDAIAQIAALKDKDSVKQLMQMAGMENVEVNFDIEQIEGGAILKCKTQEDKDALKSLLDKLFHGELLKKLLEQVSAIFGKMGDFMGMSEKKEE
ncbi:MAG: hypothetical protein RBG13Loki_1445 [Promethearchaeota archaeon CR_4]|nr:MAG: hypothetical protein RBG13Loki_1445 [Candidatus Lokiarchaeota archaeon CR_4]